MKLTKKQILEIKKDEISLCPCCYSMTITKIMKGEIRCGKCGGRK